ncbi:MAG: hypothetical protein VXW32_01145 [Myxococcota bacterium]|nr:hypothetical protein [Myxococcota bacterium]
MIPSKAASLLLAASGLSLIWACAQKSDGGFGGGGSSFDPVTDTGPWYSDEDTGGDSGDTDSNTETGGGGDTGETDSDTASDTGEPGPVIEGTGYAKGDIAYNLIAKDQDEDDWSLHDQYGTVTVVVFGEAWDSRFQSISSYLAELETTYGVKTAPVVLTNNDEMPADEEDAELWSTTYGLDTVLWDPSTERALQTDWAPIVRPRLFLINEEMEIRWVNEGITNEVQLSEKIEDILF